MSHILSTVLLNYFPKLLDLPAVSNLPPPVFQVASPARPSACRTTAPRPTPACATPTPGPLWVPISATRSPVQPSKCSDCVWVRGARCVSLLVGSVAAALMSPNFHEALEPFYYRRTRMHCGRAALCGVPPLCTLCVRLIPRPTL